MAATDPGWGGMQRAQKLLEMGQIDPNQFNMVYGAEPPPPAPEPEPAVSPLAAAAAAPADTTPVSSSPMALAQNEGDPLGLGSAYANAYPPTPTTTEGLSPRDAGLTRAYANAYGGGPITETPAPPAAPAPMAPAPQSVAPANQVAGGAAAAGTPPPIDPNQIALDAAMAPYTLRAQALLDATKTGEAKAAEEAAGLERMQKEQAKKLQIDQEWDAKQKLALDQQRADLKKRSDDIAAMKVDPNRLWAQKSTGEKIMSGIAMALGAFGTRDGGGNPGVRVIKEAIDRDIDLQRADIQSAGDALKRDYTLYGEAFSRYKDERIARDAARLHGLEVAELGLKALAAKYKAPEMQAKALDALGQLEAEKQIYREKIMSSLQARNAMQGLQGGQSFNPMALPENVRSLYVPGYGMALDNESAKYIRERAPDVETSRAGLQELIGMAKETRLDKASPAQRERANQLRDMLQGTLRVDLLGPGTVSDSDRALLEKIIADPNKIFSLGNEVVRLETLLERINYRWQRELNVRGISTQDQRFNFKEKK